jgi:hypothetical protein
MARAQNKNTIVQFLIQKILDVSDSKKGNRRLMNYS